MYFLHLFLYRFAPLYVEVVEYDEMVIFINVFKIKTLLRCDSCVDKTMMMHVLKIYQWKNIFAS